MNVRVSGMNRARVARAAFPEDEGVNMQRLTDTVYVETEFEGSNVGVVATGSGLVLIDTPPRPSDAVQWRKFVEGLGPVRYVINTEHHFDHTLGNFFFPGRVVAHEGTRANFFYRTLTQGVTLENPRPIVEAIDPDGLPLIRDYRPRVPEITFSDRMTIRLGGHRIELTHMPGHVPNGIAVHVLPDRVLFAGDNLFHQSMPWLQECDPWKWQESLERLRAFDAAAVVPGHGPVCDRAPLDVLRGFLAEVVATVKAQKERGLTRQQVEEEVSFIDRFPIEPEYEKIAPLIQRRNVSRVYDLLD